MHVTYIHIYFICICNILFNIYTLFDIYIYTLGETIRQDAIIIGFIFMEYIPHINFKESFKRLISKTCLLITFYFPYLRDL